MRRLKRLIALLILLMMLPAAALGEAQLLPQLDAWQNGTLPVQVTLTAQCENTAEFDENRLAQLNALLRHVTLTLQFQEGGGETWGSVGIAVDGQNALSLTVNETSDRAYAQLSCIPDTTYTAATGENVEKWLLGGEESHSALTLDNLTSPWLQDGYAMLDGLPALLADYTAEKAVKTNVARMGTAKTRQTITIPAENAGILPETLASLCADPETAAVMASAVFSGKQTITVFRNGDGAMIKATYSGRCGTDEDHLRKVSLTWCMRRDDDNTRDEITLKTPAVKGNDYNTLNFKRTETVDERGTVKLTATYTHNSRSGSDKASVTGECSLEAMPTDAGVRLTGKISRSVSENGGDEAWLIVEPDLVFADDDLRMTGTAAVETRTKKRTENRWLFTLDMTYGSYFEWLLHDSTVDMDALEASGKLATAREEITAAAAQALIRPLVLLPYEDTLYLSDGLDEAVWQSIVDSAREALK